MMSLSRWCCHKFGFIIKILIVIFTGAHLAQADDPEYRVKGSSEPISAKEGSDAVLPFHVTPSLDVSMMTVELKCDNVTVYERRKGRNETYDPKFKGRIHHIEQELAKGNMSLMILNVTKQDKGTYTCILWKDKKPIKGTVQLKIVESMNTDEQGGGDDKKDNKGWSTGEIVCAVVGGVVLVVIGGVLFALKRTGRLPCFRHEGQEGEPHERQQMKQQQPPPPEQDPPARGEEENPFIPQQILPDDVRE